jgi:hypothetical protein
VLYESTKSGGGNGDASTSASPDDDTIDAEFEVKKD